MKEIIEMYKDGKTIKEVSEIFGVSYKKVRKILVENKVKIRGFLGTRTRENLATNKKYIFDENYFENIDNDEKAYWLGFLFADGCVLDRKNSKNPNGRGMVLEVGLKGEDFWQLFNLRKCLKSNNPIRYKKVKLGDKEYDSYRFCVASKKLCEDLIKLGCVPRKSLTLKYPESLEEIYFPSFVRGYFDGDGWFSFIKTEKQAIYSLGFIGTIEFLNSIKIRLESFGIRCSDIRKTESKAYNMKMRNYDIYKFFNLIYDSNIPFHMLGRKYDLLISALECRKDEYKRSEVAKLAKLIV